MMATREVLLAMVKAAAEYASDVREGRYPPKEQPALSGSAAQ